MKKPVASKGAGSAAAKGRGSQARGGRKILRVCIVQNGKVIDEQRMGAKDSVSVGYHPKNTFVVNTKSGPKRHFLFHHKGSGYELVLSEGMRGRISVGEDVVDFSGLQAKGVLKQKGGFQTLDLSEDHRGKVIIGDVTIIFQFVVPPPKPAKPKLPPAARGSFKNAIDLPFALILAAVIFVEGPLLIYLRNAPMPSKLTLETMDDRWANLIVPDRPKAEKKKEKPKPKKDDTKKADAVKKEEKNEDEEPIKDEPPKNSKEAKAKAVKKAKIRKSIESKGVLAILGTLGAGGAAGAVADVFGDGNLTSDLDSAFEGISGVGVATEKGQRTKRGGGSGEAASIGGLATKGGGKVGLGKKKESRVGSVKTETPKINKELDGAAIARVVRRRMKSVQACYERELKRNPSLSGKIEVEFTIGENGRIEEALIAYNGMGSKPVGNCIVSRIRRWKFPKPDGGSVTVNFPFIFSSAG